MLKRQYSSKNITQRVTGRFQLELSLLPCNVVPMSMIRRSFHTV